MLKDAASMSSFSPAEGVSGDRWNTEFTAEQASQTRRTGPCPLAAGLDPTGCVPTS